jgi:hypothetical protein
MCGALHAGILVLDRCGLLGTIRHRDIPGDRRDGGTRTRLDCSGSGRGKCMGKCRFLPVTASGKSLQEASWGAAVGS